MKLNYYVVGPAVGRENDVLLRIVGTLHSEGVPMGIAIRITGLDHDGVAAAKDVFREEAIEAAKRTIARLGESRRCAQ